MRLIDQMLRETAEGTDGIEFYGHSPEPYANAEESKFPRIFVYDTKPVDTLHMNHSIETDYNILMEISDTFSLTDDGEESFEDVLDRVQKLWVKFISRLSKHPSNKKPLGKINRVEIVHHLDHNVAGYLCTFTVTPYDTPDYQCP